jgi:hypothetical protein
VLGGSDGATIGLLAGMAGFGSGAFSVLVLAIDVPEIVVAGKLRFGVLLLFELGGLLKLDRNITIIRTPQKHFQIVSS